MSVNGIIADKDGGEDFLNDVHWDIFSELVRSRKNLIIGRKAFETVKQWNNGYGFNDFKETIKIILTKNEQYKTEDGYMRAASPEQALGILREQGHNRALIAGGATVNTAFLKRNLVNEIILTIEPVIIGGGIPLLTPTNLRSDLKLIRKTELPNDIIRLHYEVIQQSGAQERT